MAIADITIDQVRSFLPARPDDGHKGTFGHLFVVAGSRGFTGAAKLACMAASRSGVGLVTLGVARPLADVMASALVEAMSLVLPSTPEETISRQALEPALAFAADKQAVVLGPGLSQHPSTRDFVLAFVEKCPAPLLVDADGLNALATQMRVLRRAKAPIVLTPHPGEMARLMGCSTREVQEDRENAACTLASEFNCTVVLKGHGTIVADPSGNAFRNPTGNQGMAKGGSGDVLSGLIGGLMAQGISPMQAALAGTYVHGMAGDIAAHIMTPRGMTASDMVEAIPEAWHMLDDSTNLEPNT